jgi:hypothetical protein
MVPVAYQNMVIIQSVINGSGCGGGFGPALAISCAMHLLLLWPELPPPAGGQPQPALTASLRLTGAAEALIASTPAVTGHSLEPRQPAIVPSPLHAHRRPGEAVGPPPAQPETQSQGEVSPAAAQAAAGRGEAPQASAEAPPPDSRRDPRLPHRPGARGARQQALSAAGARARLDGYGGSAGGCLARRPAAADPAGALQRPRAPRPRGADHDVARRRGGRACPNRCAGGPSPCACRWCSTSGGAVAELSGGG